jgi:hypothetical protein
MDFLASLFERALNFFLPTGDPAIDRRRRFRKLSFFAALIAVAFFGFYMVAGSG